ncbi:MAG: metal-dependent transcriptional regulator [Candidatus Ranarchaeia archaeon]
METLSLAVKEYLEELYRLQISDSTPATSPQLAKRLHHAKASVTEMVQWLSKEGYINWQRYKPSFSRIS